MEEECEEQRQYERRENDKLMNAVCDRLEAQDSVLSQHTKALNAGAEQFELIRTQLDNHSIFMQDMMRLYKEAMDLHNKDVEAGKKSRKLIRDNAKSIENIEYAMEAKAKADEPMLAILMEVKQATSIMGWFVKRWKATIIVFAAVTTYAIDIWHDVSKFVGDLLNG